MTVPAKVLRAVASFALLLPVCGFAPNPSQKIGADVIVTAAPAYEPLAAIRSEERFPKGAQLLLLHDGKAEPLVGNFAATADANVSFDAKKVLFSGKKSASDAWQIWELTLENHVVRQLTTSQQDAIHPIYLPEGRMVYALRTPQGFQLEAERTDSAEKIQGENNSGNSTILPLTYLHASAVPVDVLADGRILFEAGFPLGSGAVPELFLVYSDGSGVESYRCDHGTAPAKGRWGGKQLASGDVVFTHGGSLARFTSPLAHEERIAAPHAEYAGAIAETASGAWLVSARSASSMPYTLKLWKAGAAASETVYARNGENLVEPVLLAPRNRPRRHPSALHDWDYANLLALDARISRDGALQGVPVAVRLEMQDAAGRAVAMGTAPVEKDGSFFVKAPPDNPIRFALLDEKGSVLRQEHGWFWIRRGEQRICVGCHAGPERASENHVPAVLLRTTTPVDVTGAAQRPLPGGN
jgi:hypothetical protein